VEDPLAEVGECGEPRQRLDLLPPGARDERVPHRARAVPGVSDRSLFRADSASDSTTLVPGSVFGSRTLTRAAGRDRRARDRGCAGVRSPLSAAEDALGVREISQVPCVVVPFTRQERHRLRAASPIGRGGRCAGAAAVAEPGLLTLDERRAIRPAPDQPEDGRGPRVDPPIRSKNGALKATFDLDGGLGMGRARKRRPRLMDDRRTGHGSASPRAHKQRDEDEERAEPDHSTQR
jgi:hypothetical protein